MWTNDFIRVPFEEKGRDRNGVDCWGLVRLIYKERLGIDLPSLLDYTSTKDRINISEMVCKESLKWVEIPKGEEKEFDVVIIEMLGLPIHVGVVVGNNMMIHCEKGSGTTVVNYKKEAQWFRRIKGFYRYE